MAKFTEQQVTIKALRYFAKNDVSPKFGYGGGFGKINLPTNSCHQELADVARDQKFIEAAGSLHAGSGRQMSYQLTDAGKARALDALSQSEYYGAMPVPLDIYKEQVKRQSIRNIQINRKQLLKHVAFNNIHATCFRAMRFAVGFEKDAVTAC